MVDFSKYSWKDYDEIYNGPQHEAEDNLIREQMLEQMEDARAKSD